MDKFDAAEVLATIKAGRAKVKKVRLYRLSKLNPFLGELLALRKAGASFGDLEHWLRRQKRCLVHKTTIMRFLKGYEK